MRSGGAGGRELDALDRADLSSSSSLCRAARSSRRSRVSARCDAALGLGDRVDLVDDHRLGGGEDLADPEESIR